MMLRSRRGWEAYASILLLVLAAAGAQCTCALDINGVTCPDQTKQLSDGAILNKTSIPMNSTYYLPPGRYTVNQHIDYAQGSICLVGQASDRALVRIQSAIDQYEPQTLFWFNGVVFGMRGLTFDGGADLLNLYNKGQLGMDDVTVQAFGGAQSQITAIQTSESKAYVTNTVFSGNTNGAVQVADFLTGTVAVFDKVEFIGNSAVGQLGQSEKGGAMQILGTDTTIKNSVFRDNTALRGGAISVEGFLEQSNVTLEEVTFFNNKALSKDGSGDSGQGGALFIQEGGEVTVTGALCAQDNKADFAGGFANVQANGRLLFATGSNANVAKNVPSDIAILDSGEVQCVSAGSKPWVLGSYEITGPVCGCSSAFEQTTGNCDSCGALGWDATTCSCNKAGPQLECTSGQCCNTTANTFLPNGTACSIGEIVQGLAKSSNPGALARAAGYPDPAQLMFAADGPESEAMAQHAYIGAPGTVHHDEERWGDYSGPQDNGRDPSHREHQYGGDSADVHEARRGPKHLDDDPYRQKEDSIYDRSAFDPFKTDAAHHPTPAIKTCAGTCSSGQCKLNVVHEGCCYLLAAQKAASAEYYGSGHKHGGYKIGGHRRLLCWGNEEGTVKYGLLE